MKRLSVKALLLSLIFVSSVTWAAKPVWLDVRSAEEHATDHIKGDKQVDYKHVVKSVEKAYPDKSTPLRLYCRSGRRAGIAMTLLKEAGYKDVKNMGSINEARKIRKLVK